MVTRKENLIFENFFTFQFKPIKILLFFFNLYSKNIIINQNEEREKLTIKLIIFYFKKFKRDHKLFCYSSI